MLFHIANFKLQISNFKFLFCNLQYRLAKGAGVTISIYNLRGQLVRMLSLGKKEAGSYINKEKAAYWDGRNTTGESVSSGVYFYHLQAGDFSASRKMLILK